MVMSTLFFFALVIYYSVSQKLLYMIVCNCTWPLIMHLYMYKWYINEKTGAGIKE